MDLGWSKIGNYEISNLCFLSYPCQHQVKDTRTGLTRLMNGTDIHNMLKKDGLTDNHFNSCCPSKIGKEHPYNNTNQTDFA